MSTPSTVRVSLENLATGAHAPAPGEGRRAAVEADADGVRRLLESFAGLPSLEAEDANARIYLVLPALHLVVRHAGGRLIVEEGDSFTNATVDEIMAQLFAPRATANAAAVETGPGALPSGVPRDRGKIWALAALLAVFSLLAWWSVQPETPDGVEWLGSADARQAILVSAAGNYTNEEEHLTIDAMTARLVVTDKAGEETLRTVLRVGHRAGVPVLVTEAGALFEVATDRTLRLEEAVYRRVP